MFIENNYIPSQPSFVKQFLFFSDKLSISLIILEAVPCTCFSLNSLNSSFFGMPITRVAHRAPKDISAVLRVSCAITFAQYHFWWDSSLTSSFSSNGCPPNFWLHFPSTPCYYCPPLQYFIPFLRPPVNYQCFIVWQCSQALSYQPVTWLPSYFFCWVR